MSTAPDLSKLRIDRDQPAPAVTRALKRAAWLATAALLLLGAFGLWLKRGSAVPVQVVTVSLGAPSGSSGAPVDVVANGYVVARTKAAVSAKIAGRLASLYVSEGSRVAQGDVIARLENADYAAAVAQAAAQVATARATLIELTADRDEMQREFNRIKAIHAENANLSRETFHLIAADPRIASGPDGRALISPEVYVVINIPRAEGAGINNVVARGVNESALAVRNVHLIAGRMFQSGRSEIIIGKKIVPRFAHTALGDTLRFASRDWVVVGHFDAGGSALESEVWGENEQYMPVFRGDVFQSVTFRLRDPAAFDEVKRSLEGDRRMELQVQRESAFYAGQAGILTGILTFLAIMITSVMAVGAVFGAINTMYAAVSSRTPEIAVLLTVGFKPRSVLASFLAESAVIAFIGGIAGGLLALPINGVVTSTTNWASFSEVAFAFRVTPGLLVGGVVFAVVMGLVGGFFPAWRAARLQVVQALR